MSHFGYKTLATAGIFGVLLVAVAFTIRAATVDREANQLCSVLYTLIARAGATTGTPGSPGYAYYREHPTELVAARKQNDAFLAELPCSAP